VPAHIRLVDNSRAFLKDFEAVIDRRMDRVAEELVEKMKQNVSQPGPEPSAPGEFPHMQSGEFEESFFWQRDTQGGRIVGSSSDHALVLERGSSRMAARPTIERTLRQMWGRIQAVLAGR
jgi:hypothetical protein